MCLCYVGYQGDVPWIVEFNGENYLQIGGTAMGTRVAPILHHDLIHKPVTRIATTNRLPLVLTYNLTNPDVIGLVTKFWPILQTSVKGAILFKDLPVRAFRRSPNLRDHLVKAALKSNTPKTSPYPYSHVKYRTVKPANLSNDETNCLRTTGSTNSQKTSIVKPTMSSISWNAHVVKNNTSAKLPHTIRGTSRWYPT